MIRGVSFDKSEVTDTAASGYVPILRAGNIGETLHTQDDLVWVPEYKVGASQMLKLYDVVICMSSGSADVVGKTAQLQAEWHGSVGAFCGIIRFRKIDPRFRAFWLRSPGFRAWRDSQAKGANIQNLRKAELESLELSVPPPDEQERIVRILDEAEELRRLRAQAKHRTSEIIPALFCETFGDPGRNEKNWPTMPFADCFEDETARNAKLQQKDYAESGTLPVIDQGQDFVAGYTSDTAFRCASRPPFIVFGDHTRVVKLVEFDCAIGADGTKVFTGKEGFDIGFLSIHLSLSPIPELGYSRHMRELRRLSFMKPPIELQRAFAAYIVEIRALEVAQAASRKRLDDLFQTLLYRAFQGEL